MGTWIDGKPVVGEKNWLLSPPGVFRSPIRRGGLLHVGYTHASIFCASIVFVTAVRTCSRYAISALQASVSGPLTVAASACSRRTWTDGWNLRDFTISASDFTGTRSPCPAR